MSISIVNGLIRKTHRFQFSYTPVTVQETSQFLEHIRNAVLSISNYLKINDSKL